MLETAGEIARQVEDAMMGAAGRGEELRIVWIIVAEALVQVGADFIDRPRDRWSNDRSYTRTAGTQVFHGGDGRIGDAGERAFPSGMGSADDTRFGIGEQDRCTVGCQDAKRNSRRRRHHRITAWRVGRIPGRDHGNRVAAVVLPSSEERGTRNTESSCHHLAVAGDRRPVVTRAEAAVQ